MFHGAWTQASFDISHVKTSDAKHTYNQSLIL